MKKKKYYVVKGVQVTQKLSLDAEYYSGKTLGESSSLILSVAF